MQVKLSNKRALITKTQSTIVLVTATAAFVLIFTAFGVKTLLSQASYQNRVIAAKKDAVRTLEDNLESREALIQKYKAFVNTQQNKLGGDPRGGGPQDGDNAKITLDALPSKYDFPALATSLDKLLLDQNLRIQSITGTDDEVAQTVVPAGDPQPVAIPFQVSVSGSYGSMQRLVDAFDRSIRPIKIHNLQMSGGEGDMNMTVTAETYYQPEKTFTLTKEVVK
jgi:hypothetical protein